VFVTGCRRAKRERYHTGMMAHDPCAWTAPEQLRESRELSKAMARAIDELNPDFREALLLVDVAEWPYREAALELGVPVGTVMSRLHRARRALRTRLDESQSEAQS
jgi:RNA polymerase sigma-70 factor, ECF subfamily